MISHEEGGLIGDNFLFQHTNYPKHIANVIKTYLQRKTVRNSTTIRIPPQSPDLNIIETVWDYLHRKKKKKSIMGNIVECMEQSPNGISPEIA